MDIKYHEVSALNVVKYFIKDYEFSGGSELIGYDWFYDPVKGVFIFKLILQNKQEDCK